MSGFERELSPQAVCVNTWSQAGGTVGEAVEAVGLALSSGPDSASRLCHVRNLCDL